MTNADSPLNSERESMVTAHSLSRPGMPLMMTLLVRTRGSLSLTSIVRVMVLPRVPVPAYATASRSETTPSSGSTTSSAVVTTVEGTSDAAHSAASRAAQTVGRGMCGFAMAGCG